MLGVSLTEGATVARCFVCKTEVGQGGVLTEDGRLLCVHCDSKESAANATAPTAPVASPLPTTEKQAWYVGKDGRQVACQPSGRVAHCVWCDKKLLVTNEHLQACAIICTRCLRSNEVLLKADGTISTFAPPVKWTLRKTWLVLTLGPATIVGLVYLEKHPGVPEEAFVMFLSNVVGWGLVSGIGCLIYKGLKS